MFYRIWYEIDPCAPGNSNLNKLSALFILTQLGMRKKMQIYKC